MLWTTDVGEGPESWLPHIHERVPNSGCSNMAPPYNHSSQVQDLTLKLGPETQRECKTE